MNKIWFDGNTALDTENPTCEQELKSFCFEVIEPDNLRDIITYNPDGMGAVDTLDFDESEIAITLNGATYTNGRLGQGLNFDGNSTAVISGTNASSPTRELTIEAWLRPQSFSGTYVIEKAGSYAFPKFNADGSITANSKMSAEIFTQSKIRAKCISKTRFHPSLDLHISKYLKKHIDILFIII